jgi:hypothetical protein
MGIVKPTYQEKTYKLTIIVLCGIVLLLLSLVFYLNSQFTENYDLLLMVTEENTNTYLPAAVDRIP